MQDLTSPLTRADLEAFWMPFTANRQFKENPRLFVAAKDMYYTTADQRQVLDGTAGLWCVNAGHCRPQIVEAIHQQVSTLDYAPAFQMGHPGAFTLADRLSKMLPGDLNHVFFTNSGSEAVDSALKIALAYHRARGEGTRAADWPGAGLPRSWVWRHFGRRNWPQPQVFWRLADRSRSPAPYPQSGAQCL